MHKISESYCYTISFACFNQVNVVLHSAHLYHATKLNLDLTPMNIGDVMNERLDPCMSVVVTRVSAAMNAG